MQQDANDLDAQRRQRLRQIAERDAQQKAKEDETRLKNARHAGGRADFVNGYHKKAGDLSLSERMGRQNQSRVEDS